MTVSLVVPVYNEERCIGPTLESLLAQTHRDIELVVVDDGSTDGTAAVARGLGVRVISIPHSGAAAARNAGARATHGDIVVFVDGDDLFEPDFVERLVEPLEDPSVRGTFPGSCIHHEPDRGLAPGWLHVRGALTKGRQPFAATHPWPTAMRRAEYERTGGYPDVGYGEDLVFGERFGRVPVVPEARFHWRVPAGPVEIFRKARWIGRGQRFERA